MLVYVLCEWFFDFVFNDTATTEIYTLSLHDALPIYRPLSPGALREVDDGVAARGRGQGRAVPEPRRRPDARGRLQDRKSTRLNSSHANISYAVFCLKKKYDYELLISCGLKKIHCVTL